MPFLDHDHGDIPVEQVVRKGSEETDDLVVLNSHESDLGARQQLTEHLWISDPCSPIIKL
jgi:hypothetical protein